LLDNLAGVLAGGGGSSEECHDTGVGALLLVCIFLGHVAVVFFEGALGRLGLGLQD